MFYMLKAVFTVDNERN